MPLQNSPLIRIILLLYKKYTHLLSKQTSFFRSSIFKITFTYCLPKLTKVKHPRKTEMSLHHQTQAWKCIVNASKPTRHQSLLPIIWISCLVTSVEIEKVSIRDTVKLKSGLQTCKLVCKMCKTHCHFWSQKLVHFVKDCGHSHCFNERKKQCSHNKWMANYACKMGFCYYKDESLNKCTPSTSPFSSSLLSLTMCLWMNFAGGLIAPVCLMRVLNELTSS